MSRERKYLDIFVKEAEEHLTSLQHGLLSLEKDRNPALVHDLMRNAHTVKGSAKMVGFDAISSVSHCMEDLLKEIEEGEKEIETKWIDLLLQATDAVSRMIGAMMRSEPNPVDVEAFVEAFRTGELPLATTESAPREEEHGLGDTVRAKVSNLDSLVNVIGELIISRKRFEESHAALRDICIRAERSPLQNELQAHYRRSEDDILYLSYLIQQIHDEAMALRMLPLKTITEPFRRMVRDLGKEQGKEVDLRVAGEQTEMDRVVLEMLKPVLLHILRNAVDHGIESPEEREAGRKATAATVEISARHDGNSVLVSIRDDGRGIDPRRVKNIAVKRGVIDREEADLLSDEDALYLILRPGFSTRESVTEISGRGVGMDVVKESVDAVKGNLLIRSDTGKFTEFQLQLPISLSVIEALLVMCGGETLVIPLTYVQEALRIRHTEISTSGGREVIMLRGNAVPLVSLASVLGLPERKDFLAQGKMAAVVLKYRDQLLACTVDRNLGSSELVVKGLSGELKKSRFVSGGTILGDGTPALILNISDIFAAAEGTSATAFREELEESVRPRSRGKILVVDDSITTRTMERSILLSNGYDVDIAVSGEDAMEKTRRGRYDLIISDVEMPGINGFQLTRKLRETEEYRETPVIIVSSLSRDEDKRNAMESGAQAYIVKGSFEQGVLLETVEALIG